MEIKLKVGKCLGSSSGQDDFPIILRLPWGLPLGQYRYNYMVSVRHKCRQLIYNETISLLLSPIPCVDLGLQNRTTVEICTAIIAASIPSLKPLFKAILEGSSAFSRRTNNKYIGNNDSAANATKPKGNDLEMYNSRHKGMAVASGGRRHFDNESEEMILSEQDGTRKTTRVSISIEDPEECVRKT